MTDSTLSHFIRSSTIIGQMMLGDACSPLADREKVGFLGLSGLRVFGQPRVYDGVQILTIAIGVHDEVC